MEPIKIGNRFVGGSEPCFIVVEIGINHNGDVGRARKMVDAAVECGADAVKFQCFKAKDFVSDPTVTYTYQSQGMKITEIQLEMFKRYEFDEQQWREIFDYCRMRNVVCFATPQNPSDLDFLLGIIDLPVIKVGSDDLTNLGLLENYAARKKPVIISAGAAFISEIEDAVNTIRGAGNNDLAVLHCVSCYPAEAEEVNLRKMLTISQAFDVVTGYSDHAIGITAATAAVALGAKIIEKHFTLDKNLPGPDHWFSADPKELAEMVRSIQYIEKALGSYVVKPTAREIQTRRTIRRSIVAARDIAQGQVVTEELLSFKRPGTGLCPKYMKYIIGKKTKLNIKKDELVTFEKVC